MNQPLLQIDPGPLQAEEFSTPAPGVQRQVNLEKDGFPFAAARQLPHLLRELDQKWLSRLTPCNGMSHEDAIHAIAQVHVELILVHPFREGTGRIARLLADAMA